MPTTSRVKPTSQDTLARVLDKLIERDEQHHLAWSEITKRQADHGRLLESVQVDLQRMSRVLEQQAGYNERQIKLAEQTQTHAGTFERVFQEIAQARADQATSQRDFSDAFKQYIRDHDEVHTKGVNPKIDAINSAVDGFKANIRLGAIVLGVVLALVGALANSWRTEMWTALNANTTSIRAINDRELQALRIEAAAERGRSNKE